jgi:CubicO group peptidase (beta-lactamase class C family)
MILLPAVPGSLPDVAVADSWRGRAVRGEDVGGTMKNVQAGRSAVVVFAVLTAVAACGGSGGGGTATPPAARGGPTAPGGPLATSPPPPGDRTAAAMKSYLEGLAAKKKFTGAAIVVRRGQVLARFAAGEASKGVPVRPDTIFRLASVSKQFTAMLVLKQQDRGRLRLQDDICPYLVPTYVKACPKAWGSITINEILNHTSGIPDISEMPDFFPKLPKPTTTQEIISRFVDKPLEFKPGTSWRYSNSGYILAGAIVEKVAHQPFGMVLHDDITGPLGLAHTGYSNGSPPAGYARGFLSPGRPAPPLNGSQANAAGGVFSDVDDMSRWDRSCGADMVAPPATVKLAFTPQARCPSGGCLDSPSTAYAYGWLVDSLRGHRYMYHPGLLQGYHTSNGYLPDDDIAVVVLSNVQDTDVNGINRHLATMALTGS